MAKKYCEEQLPQFLASFEAMLKQNKGGDGFFVGDQVNDYAIILLSFFSGE